MTSEADHNGAELAPEARQPVSSVAAVPEVRTDDGGVVDLRSRLLQSGWTQGSVLPPELTAYVQLSPGAETAAGGNAGPDGPWYVLVTQDCDIVYGDCVTDPVAEVVLATKIAQLDTEYENLRDPRVLHVMLTGADGPPQPTEIKARNRGFLDRVRLLTAAPASTLRADSAAMRRIAGFLGRRYQRTAWPEEFDRRFKSAKGKLAKILRTRHDVLLDIVLSIDPRTGPHANSPYEASLWVVIQDEFADRNAQETQGTKTQILDDVRRAVQKCQGIQFDTPKVVGRYGISLREWDDLLPLDLAWPRLAAEESA